MKKMILLITLLFSYQSFALGGIGNLGFGNLNGIKMVKKNKLKKPTLKEKSGALTKKRKLASKTKPQNIWNLEEDSQKGLWF